MFESENAVTDNRRDMFESEKAVIEKYVSMSSGDEDTWAGGQSPYDLFADDVVYEIIGTTPVSGTMRGMKEIREKLLDPFWENLEKVTLLADEIVALEDGRVLLIGGSRGLAKNGRRYDQQYMYLFTVRHDKIVHILKFCDTVLIETSIFGRVIK